jgi:glycosyltransferase involved in cell wall biosynthesis
MKICFLADIRSIHTRRWVGFFAQKNDTHLITFDYPEDADRVSDGEQFFSGIGVTVHKIRKSLPFILISPFIARRIIKTIKPDIVHAHFVTQYGFFGSISGTHPLVITAWGDDVLIHPVRSIVYRYMVTYTLKKADLITCDGENTENSMVELGANRLKIMRIYFGVDTKKFSPETADRDLLASKFNFPNAKVVIYLRGFDPVYNAETLIEAIPLILPFIPQARFLLVGGGEQMEILKRLVAGSNFKEAVFFIGRIANDELPWYIASSDICVSTSLSDSGIAASTAESMACGIPVVSTECGDIKLWIQDGINGYIIEKKNPAMLAERVVLLLSDDTLRKQFGTRCRDIIVSKQDYYKEMKKVDGMYLQLVGGKRP